MWVGLWLKPLAPDASRPYGRLLEAVAAPWNSLRLGRLMKEEARLSAAPRLEPAARPAFLFRSTESLPLVSNRVAALAFLMFLFYEYCTLGTYMHLPARS